jgi:non-ribosomal peptide synthetase component F
VTAFAPAADAGVCLVHEPYENEMDLPAGKPCHTLCYILDAFLRPLPLDIVGQLYVRGDGVTAANANEMLSGVLNWVTDPFDDGTLLATGYMGRWRQGGILEIVGKLGEKVKKSQPIS